MQRHAAKASTAFRIVKHVHSGNKLWRSRQLASECLVGGLWLTFDGLFRKQGTKNNPVEFCLVTVSNPALFHYNFAAHHSQLHARPSLVLAGLDYNRKTDISPQNQSRTGHSRAPLDSKRRRSHCWMWTPRFCFYAPRMVFLTLA